MSATQQLLRFGVFELNLATAELRKAGMLIKLQPQPFQLLAMLASRAGQVVTRDAIQMELWTVDSEVDFEHGVRQCIAQIRTALGDNADNPRYVETIPRQGYRFVAPVESKTVSASPKVVEFDSWMETHGPLPVAGQAGQRAAAVAPSYAAAPPDAEAAAQPARDVADIHKSRSRVRRVRLLWTSAAVLLVALIGGGLYWRAHKAPVLTEKDTIVLADFDNSAGDPVFDDTLKQGLAIQLEQSPFLNVLSDRKVAGTLKLMNRSGSERLTEDVAREVCLRTNSKAMLTGSIARLGHEYVLGLKAVDCNTGDVLADVQEQAAGKEAVLKALDAAAVSVRSKLGESLSSVQKYATPLMEATTPSSGSAESLQSWDVRRSSRKVNPAALPFFKRAAELDPNFAVRLR